MLLARRFSVCLLCMFSLLLTACSRDNPLSFPATIEEEEEEICNELPLDMFDLLTHIEINDGHKYYPYSIADQDEDLILDLRFLIDRVQLYATYNDSQVFTRDSFDSEMIERIRTNILEDSNLDRNVDVYIKAEGYVPDGDDITFPIAVIIDGNVTQQNRDYFTDLYAEETIDEAILGLDVNNIDVTLNRVIGSGAITEEGQDAFTLEAMAYSDYVELASDLDNQFEIQVTAAINFPKLLSNCSIEDIAGDVIPRQEVRTYDLHINRASVSSLNDDKQVFQSVSDQGDQYGTSVAISGFDNQLGEGQKLVAIGTPFDDSNALGAYTGASFTTQDQDNSALDSGSVYIIIEDATTGIFDEEAYIKASNAEAGDKFGYAVSLDQDMLAVSAPGEDSASTLVGGREDDNIATNSGAVYIFERSYDSDLDVYEWIQTAYIKAPNHDGYGAEFDQGFGEAIVLKDGILLVGAPREDEPTKLNSGAVYRYRLTSDEPRTWQYAGVIKAPVTDQNDQFGFSLATSESRLFIGAPGEDSNFNGVYSRTDFADPDNPVFDNSETDSGAAYYYDIDTLGNIAYRGYIKPSASDPGDSFGWSLEAGNGSLFVGAPFEDGNGQGLDRNLTDNSLENSGAVFGFGFEEGSSTISEYVYIKPPLPQEGSRFGEKISVDLNDLLIGATNFENYDPFNVNEVASLGRVFVYEFDDFSAGALDYEIELSAEQMLDDTSDGEIDAFYGQGIDLFDGTIVTGVPGHSTRVSALNDAVGLVVINK